MASPLVGILVRFIGGRIIKRIREKRMLKNILKGKLTYSALGTLLVAIATQALGDGVINAEDWNELAEAVAVLVAVFGRWRATKE